MEIITSKTSPGPSRDWINIVGSSQTKNKIRQFFKKERREENIVNGRDMLEHECRRLGYDTAKLLTSENLKEVATRSHFDGSEENLLAAIGYGGVLCIETGGRRRAWAVPAGASSPLFRSSKT